MPPKAPFGHPLKSLLAQRIVFMDGAMGTMIQRYQLTEEDFRGELLKDHPRELKGNNDLLSLTRPDIIQNIHENYLRAGCDIIETNTFSATTIAQEDYATQHLAGDINKRSAQLARAACQRSWRKIPLESALWPAAWGQPTRPAPSPPTFKPRLPGRGLRSIGQAYYSQAQALLDGGVDILLPETTFDTLNLKAAIFALEKLFAQRRQRPPVMLSVTITDNSGRTLSGQTIEAFWYSVMHCKPLSVGINCALGPGKCARIFKASPAWPIVLSAVTPMPAYPIP